MRARHLDGRLATRAEVAASGEVAIAVYDRNEGERILEVTAQKAGSVRRDAVRLRGRERRRPTAPREAPKEALAGS